MSYNYISALLMICIRANRAQFSEVSFQSVTDDDIVDAALPSMQGIAEDEGSRIRPFSCFFFGLLTTRNSSRRLGCTHRGGILSRCVLYAFTVGRGTGDIDSTSPFTLANPAQSGGHPSMSLICGSLHHIEM